MASCPRKTAQHHLGDFLKPYPALGDAERGLPHLRIRAGVRHFYPLEEYRLSRVQVLLDWVASGGIVRKLCLGRGW